MFTNELMRGFRSVLLLVLLLAGPPGCSDPTGTCGPNRDTGNPCSQPSTATRTGNDWRVIVRTTTTTKSQYPNDGVLCDITHTSCVTKECNYVGAGDSLNSTSAIAQCRGS